MSTPLQTTAITNIPVVVGNLLSASYEGLPNNLPNSYGNYLVVWRNQNTIPWNDATPDGYAPIEGNSSQGSQVVDQIEINVGVSYIVGYAVGPKGSGANMTWENVCATAFIPASATDPVTYKSSALNNFQVLSDSVTMNFQLPDGATPKTNGAWVGIWQTGQASYTTAPVASNAITIDSSQGGAAINGVSILRGQVYTVALFTSGWKAGAGGVNVQTAMACTATITT
ncbi:MAG: hypothetical protein R2800_03840 [Flavipsychrobacter sp.]